MHEGENRKSILPATLNISLCFSGTEHNQKSTFRVFLLWLKFSSFQTVLLYIHMILLSHPWLQYPFCLSVFLYYKCVNLEGAPCSLLSIFRFLFSFFFNSIIGVPFWCFKRRYTEPLTVFLPKILCILLWVVLFFSCLAN